MAREVVRFIYYVVLYIIMDIRIVTCNRCEHSWATRKKKDPKWCPKCKSPYWNKERKQKKK